MLPFRYIIIQKVINKILDFFGTKPSYPHVFLTLTARPAVWASHISVAQRPHVASHYHIGQPHSSPLPFCISCSVVPQ